MATILMGSCAKNAVAVNSPGPLFDPALPSLEFKGGEFTDLGAVHELNPHPQSFTKQIGILFAGVGSKRLWGVYVLPFYSKSFTGLELYVKINTSRGWETRVEKVSGMGMASPRVVALLGSGETRDISADATLPRDWQVLFILQDTDGLVCWKKPAKPGVGVTTPDLSSVSVNGFCRFRLKPDRYEGGYKSILHQVPEPPQKPSIRLFGN